jgi:hypothetical protein
MGKTDEARQVVAQHLLGLPLGSQMPTTSELAAAAQAGLGTIQTALRSLEADDVIATTAHGGQGRRLVTRNLPALWAATGRGALTGVLPLPYSSEFSGLATALTQLAEERGLALQLLFRQGNSNRLQFLRSMRVDFTVMSVVAAKGARRAVSYRPLGDYTYYGRDAVVVITPVGREPDLDGPIPVDRKSFDHTALTEAEFPDAKLVHRSYLLIPELVARGEFGAAVWHQTSSSPLLTASGLAIHPLHKPSPAGDTGLSRAALVWRAGDEGVAAVLGEAFGTSQIEEIQREVMAGARIPEF